MKGLRISLEEARQHQAKHGFPVPTGEGSGQVAKAIPRANMALRRKRTMTRPEREFAVILEAMKRRGEILRYEYEGITLRWPVGNEVIRYTPDFVVFVAFCGSHGGMALVAMKFIEIKGPYITGKFERAIERFRHARTYWEDFTFELHQRDKEGRWQRIH